MQRDFVVQIRPDVPPGKGEFQGRVEHVDTGRSAHFRTVEEFLSFIASVCATPMPSAGVSNDEQQAGISNRNLTSDLRLAPVFPVNLDFVSRKIQTKKRKPK